MFWRRTETISSGLNLITDPLGQLVVDGFDLGSDAGVILEVADPHGQTAEQVGIDTSLQHRLALERVAELADQALALVLGQRHGGPYVDQDLASALFELLLVTFEDRA